eukprot:GCRY01002634.1.p1 GENE.GCRY01002634.1~~GCRY01002634.1.p1  ORF type:complete len:518 (+),score=106.27 GCRY01002634.1:194-1747(+)
MYRLCQTAIITFFLVLPLTFHSSFSANFVNDKVGNAVLYNVKIYDSVNLVVETIEDFVKTQIVAFFNFSPTLSATVTEQPSGTLVSRIGTSSYRLTLSSSQVLVVGPTIYAKLQSGRDFEEFSFGCSSVREEEKKFKVWNCDFDLTSYGFPATLLQDATLTLVPDMYISARGTWDSSLSIPSLPVDTIPPTAPVFTLTSTATSPLTLGDSFTITVTASEPLQSAAVAVGGLTTDMANSAANTWTHTVSLPTQFAEGAIAPTVTLVDLAGNAATLAATNLTAGSDFVYSLACSTYLSDPSETKDDAQATYTCPHHNLVATSSGVLSSNDPTTYVFDGYSFQSLNTTVAQSSLGNTVQTTPNCCPLPQSRCKRISSLISTPVGYSVVPCPAGYRPLGCAELNAWHEVSGAWVDDEATGCMSYLQTTSSPSQVSGICCEESLFEDCQEIYSAPSGTSLDNFVDVGCPAGYRLYGCNAKAQTMSGVVFRAVYISAGSVCRARSNGNGSVRAQAVCCKLASF